MTKLIINADDFGLTGGVNRGIIRAHREGVLSSATLMAVGLAWQEAVALAGANPTLGVGVHLTLTAQAPVLPPARVPSLVDGEGYFRRQLLNVPRLDRRQVEDEWRAQIQRLLEAGLRPTHLDSHHHVHLLPPLMTIACRLAEEFAIPALRAMSPLSFKLMRVPLWQRLLTSASWQRAADYLPGVPASVTALEKVKPGNRFCTYLKKLGPGVHELYAHPGSPGDDELAAISSLREGRVEETEFLCTRGLKDSLASSGIDLASYQVLWEGNAK